MSIEDIRRRLKCEEEDPDARFGIRVFTMWVYWQGFKSEPLKQVSYGGSRVSVALKALIDLSDNELELLWARFIMEASEEDVAACAQVYESPEKHDTENCGCEDCAESRAAEAEYYAEMRRDDAN